MNSSLTALQKTVGLTQRLVERMAEAFVLREVFEAGKSALEYAASLKVQGQQIGLTTEQLQIYRYAAGQVNVDQDALDLGVRKLTASLGKASVGATGPTKALAAMGISVRDANGSIKTTGTLLPEIADKLSKVHSPLQRAAEEVTLFGRSGQQLDPLLTQGSKGIDDFKKRAEDLGLVLSDQLSEKAHEAEVRMRELNLQLKVNFASVVAQNADAILGLASALEAVTVKAINFVNNYPRLASALAGAAAGAVLAGPTGAIIGGGAGFVAGELAKRSADDSNTDPGFRAKALNDARIELARRQADENSHSFLGGLFKIRHGTGDGGTATSAAAEVARQQALSQSAAMQRAAAKVAAATGGASVRDFLASPGPKGPRGKSAEELAAEAQRREKAFQDQIASLNGDLISARRDNLTSADDIATNARQQLMAERTRLIIDTEAKVKSGDYTRAQADLIEQKAAQVAAEKGLTINTELAAKKADDALNIQIAANDNQRDLLQAQDLLSVTAKDRRDIALKLLDLDQQEERAKLEAVLASQQSTDAEKKIAQARLNLLPSLYSARAAGINQQNAGPLQAYINGIPKGADQISERVQQLEVDELESVRQGINNAIDKALHIKDPLLKGLIDLFIQENLIKPLADAFRAHNGGGGLLGSILGLGAKLAGSFGGSGAGSPAAFGTPDFSGAGPIDGLSGLTLPAFANGTTGAPGGLSLVGENGPELVRLPTGAQVVPSPRVPKMFSPMNDNPSMQVTIHGDFRGADPAAVAAINTRLDRMQKELPGTIVSTMADARSRFVWRSK